jgi:chromosome condensin MukBEF complex kleisin-like MukF subunit
MKDLEFAYHKAVRLVFNEPGRWSEEKLAEQIECSVTHMNVVFKILATQSFVRRALVNYPDGKHIQFARDIITVEEAIKLSTEAVDASPLWGGHEAFDRRTRGRRIKLGKPEVQSSGTATQFSGYPSA